MDPQTSVFRRKPISWGITQSNPLFRRSWPSNHSRLASVRAWQVVRIWLGVSVESSCLQCLHTISVRVLDLEVFRLKLWPVMNWVRMPTVVLSHCFNTNFILFIVLGIDWINSLECLNFVGSMTHRCCHFWLLWSKSFCEKEVDASKYLKRGGPKDWWSVGKFEDFETHFRIK
jgi:hypothetical protein